MSDEKDYLLISQLTQAGYCLRRAALIMNEQIHWESWENVTVLRRRRMRMDVRYLLWNCIILLLRKGRCFILRPTEDIRFY